MGSMWLDDSDTWSASTKRASTPMSMFYNQNMYAADSDDSNPTPIVQPLKLAPVEKHDVHIDVEALKEGNASLPETWTPTRNEWLIMISLAFISLSTRTDPLPPVVALDASILVTVLPVSPTSPHFRAQEIAHKLNGTSIEAFWAGTSYLLTSAIFQPVIASVSNTFGRQQLLIFSLVLFTVGTILCSVAKDFTILLTGRCIQGIGGGGIITLTQVIFCDIVPLRLRPKYFPLVLGSWSIGSIIGPVLGGLLTEKASWRWCFHINYPFCGVGLVVAIVFVRLNRVAELTLAQKMRQTDWSGAYVFVGGMTSLLVGLSWGGVQYPWSSAATLAPIVAGLVALVGFGLWQRVAKHSLLPMSIFYNWSAIAAFYCALINGLILFTALYYIPFYFMSVRRKTPTEAGRDTLPALCLLIPGSIVVSILTSKLGTFRWAIWAGWFITTLACGLQLLFDIDTAMSVLYVVPALIGIGTGMVLTSVNVGIQAISKPEDCAMAASMYGFFRSLGMPLGVALAGTIFQNAMSSHLSDLGLPTEIAHDSERWVYILRELADGAKKTAILESYVEGFRYVYIGMTAAAGSALVVSFVIRKFSMDKVLSAQFTAR
ncbi:major facilitator superfamily domain-containing protein [Phaeosphaeria sp. MPI-PUGE-AT-0046c]|nr:major facilitator superfamily domain-containing protein [Phaeosphaeria sp. MPI-PUGE-AT-0046c]